jgi:hypothetical protein
MKKLLFVLVFSFLPSVCFAQDAAAPVDWDKKHSDEASVELYSSYQVDLNRDGSYTEYIHRTKRVQNEIGMESEGEITLPYNRKYQIIKKLKVTLTDPSGKKFPPKLIQDADMVAEKDYSDYRKKIVTMPNVVPGSVIDFEMEVFNRQDAIKGEFFLSIAFFDTAPFKHQIISLTAPEEKILYFKDVNAPVKPAITRRDGKVTYAWEFKEDQGYDEKLSTETALPPSIDFLPYTFISTMKDWPVFSGWYWKEFMKNAGVTPEIKSAAEAITKDKKTTDEKIAALSRYLYDNFRYVALNLDAHNFEPHPAAEVFKNKFGDCKDQSVLFVTMLKALGFKAFPVLVRSQEQGSFLNMLPDTGCFSHVIVAVKEGGKTYFIDPLAEGYKPDELPLHLEGDYALIVDEKGGEAQKLPFADLKQKTSAVRMKAYLHADGSAVTELEFVLDRQGSVGKRKALKLQTELDKRTFLEYLENLTRGGKILGFDLLGLKDEYGLLTFKIKAEYPQFVKPRGPFLIFGDTEMSMSDSFPGKERKYPLWLSSESEDIKREEYVIPQGYAFEYVPPSVDLRSPWIDIKVVYIRSQKEIRQEIRKHYKRGLVKPSEYGAFKDFLIKAEQALDECIILKKIPSRVYNKKATFIRSRQAS